MTKRMVMALVLLLLAPGTTPGQQNFRVTYSVDRSQADQIRVTGWVYNDMAVDALDVYVTAEAVDAAGKVVARGIAFVTWTVGTRGNARFMASVPAAPGVTSFRVYVSSFRRGFGPQS